MFHDIVSAWLCRRPPTQLAQFGEARGIQKIPALRPRIRTNVAVLEYCTWYSTCIGIPSLIRPSIRHSYDLYKCLRQPNGAAIGVNYNVLLHRTGTWFKYAYHTGTW